MGGGPYFVPQLRDPACAGDLEFCPACAGKFGIRNSKIGEWPSFVPRLRDYEGRPKGRGAGSGRRRRVETISNDVPTGHE